ncbi:hypothetical protein AAHH87_00720 [Candidatus Hodgkinia cicadicola]
MVELVCANGFRIRLKLECELSWQRGAVVWNWIGRRLMLALEP